MEQVCFKTFKPVANVISKYMLENPFYFKEVFNKDLNRKNLIKAANEMFGERIV